MKHKIIATDLDGTLLRRKKWITNKNLDAMKRFILSGGQVCFVTGRSFTSAKKVADYFYDKTGYLVSYIAAMNGSVIYDNINKQILHTEVINEDVCIEIYEYCHANKIGFGEYTKSGLEDATMKILGYNKIIKILDIFNKRVKITPMKEYPLNDPTYKINIICKYHKKPFIKFRSWAREFVSDSIDISPTTSYLYEVTPKGINKGFAVEYLSNHLNIPLTEFIAFGDSPNDNPMFCKIPTSFIARKKHLKKLRKAQYVKGLSTKNAIAYWINKLI